jgi:hypothetical protein
MMFNGIEQEIIAWFDEKGDRYLFPEEIAKAEMQRADRLAAQLRALGINPDR